MDRGYVRLWRKSLDSAVFADPDLWRLWCVCMIEANFKDRWVSIDRQKEPVLVRRGQFLTGRFALHEKVYPKKRKSNKSASAVWRWLLVLQNLQNVNIETNSRYTLITLCNYETYAAVWQPDGQPNEQRADSGRTAGEQTVNTTENEEKVKNEENGKKKPPVKRLVFSSQDSNTAEWMFGKIRELNPNHRTPSLEGWANDIRLMRERDRRTDDEIRELFEWANAHDFWAAVILSPAKVRKQWDKMMTQRSARAKAGKASAMPTGPGQRHPADANREGI